MSTNNPPPSHQTGNITQNYEYSISWDKTTTQVLKQSEVPGP